MSHLHHTPPPHILPDDRGPHSPSFVNGEPDADPARVAHELANLLDGSLRNIGLVLSNLRDVDRKASESVNDALMQRLETADGAMHQMAVLLRRWMTRTYNPGRLHQRSLTLASAVDHAVRLVAPAPGSDPSIDVRVSITDDAAALPAGPVQTVLINVLRNSVQVIHRFAEPAPAEGWFVAIDARLCDEQLVLTVIDNGPGIDPALLDKHGRLSPGVTTRSDGGGIGLSVVRDIAADLSAQIELRNHAPRGARFIMHCSVDQLQPDPLEI